MVHKATTRDRDAWLAGQGFHVLRFSNHDVELHEHEVIAKILAAARRRQAGSP